MVTVVAFSAASLVAVLLSAAAERSVLSTSVVSVRAGAPVVSTFAELALFSILFSDGMKVTAKDLRGIHSLPLRTLLICLPLTLVLTALLVHLVVEIPWATSFLLGAALSPADPVFAATFEALEEEFAVIEDRVAFAGQFFNAAVLHYKSRLWTVPKASSQPRFGSRIESSSSRVLRAPAPHAAKF
jgi:hypothetical protein